MQQLYSWLSQRAEGPPVYTGMLPGTESHANLLFKSADGTKVILVDVTLTSGINWFPGEQSHRNRAYGLFGGFGLGVEEVRDCGGWKGVDNTSGI
jgi:hypothetical protein